MIYSRGEPLKKVPTEQLVDELFAEIDRYYAAGKQVVRDEAAAAEAREWLAENEDATAMTPERIAGARKRRRRGSTRRPRRWPAGGSPGPELFTGPLRGIHGAGRARPDGACWPMDLERGEFGTDAPRTDHDSRAEFPNGIRPSRVGVIPAWGRIPQRKP